ncbi:MAG: protein-export chaperone SecB [Candidatus Azotimanducaceae bacterium]|uniref:Protein-export protein SecB n=1 Tax=OM182 bacterium TaxID=2510334 RepID=A0A520S274_9GAMM|nr:protein-export chaperone SecB [Gammaproteobacteria bacterium]OUV67738.1 MAG: protein-export chaperone SecB [Gammaproteobacteria bacterium TMED133]RZO76580.1 MAG: protein-export chaperone SecB [OM182 bacterium]
MTEEKKVNFSVQRIYLKDSSFESPRSPDGFRDQWKPKVNLELNSSHKLIEGGLYEVVLSLTVTATAEETDAIMYLVQVDQAGIFLIELLEENARLQMLGSFCPNILFPYAREVIDSVVTKGSFPPLMLSPVNFDAIYQQGLAEKARREGKVQ